MLAMENNFRRSFSTFLFSQQKRNIKYQKHYNQHDHSKAIVYLCYPRFADLHIRLSNLIRSVKHNSKLDKLL